MLNMIWNFVVETKETKRVDVYNFNCHFSGLILFSFFKLYLKVFRRKRAKYKYSHLTFEGMEENVS